jgi:hemerythrin-like domain-containing protein
MNAPLLFDEAGDASIATTLMMSHHGFRRDLARFTAALVTLAREDRDGLGALGDEWRSFRNTLHGHHHAEDTGIFPNLAGQHEALRGTLERLTADHRRIDPLLDRGDNAFAALPETIDAALAVIRELSRLLDEHLATEEAEVIPHMRGWKTFPPPSSAEEAEMYAQGFAWASHGIAPEVLERVNRLLPAVLTSRLPAARAAFEQRWRRVWGPIEVGAATTPIPER